MKHNAHIVAKVVNPLGTVVTLPNDHEECSSEEPLDETLIHENCDEALFRPVIGARPVLCLRPTIDKNPPPPPTSRHKNQRYQGLKDDEIFENIEQEKPTGKRNRKSKQKQEKRESESIVIKNRCSEPVERIDCYDEPEVDERRDDNKEMWSSVEKLLPEPTRRGEEEPYKEMWSSVEHCRMDECSYTEMMEQVPHSLEPEPEAITPEEPADTKDRSDDDINANNNSSETTESDDSIKNRALVSVADKYTAEDNTATNMPAIAVQSVQKTSKKKAKKKRK